MLNYIQFLASMKKLFNINLFWFSFHLNLDASALWCTLVMVIGSGAKHHQQTRFSPDFRCTTIDYFIHRCFRYISLSQGTTETFIL